MAGFNPVGSTPVGSIDTGTVSPGTVLAPTPGLITLVGGTPQLSGASAVRASLIVRESLAYRQASALVRMTIRESMITKPATARLETVIREALVSSIITNSARTRFIFREVLAPGTVARLKSLVRETLMSSVPAPTGGYVSILW